MSVYELSFTDGLRDLPKREESKSAGVPLREHVRFGSLADTRGQIRDVGFTARERHTQRRHQRPLSAISGMIASAESGSRVGSCSPRALAHIRRVRPPLTAIVPTFVFD
jgi:hypothetical protein